MQHVLSTNYNIHRTYINYLYDSLRLIVVLRFDLAKQQTCRLLLALWIVNSCQRIRFALNSKTINNVSPSLNDRPESVHKGSRNTKNIFDHSAFGFHLNILSYACMIIIMAETARWIGRTEFWLALELMFFDDWTVLEHMYAFEWEVNNVEELSGFCLCWDFYPCSNYLLQVSGKRLQHSRSEVTPTSRTHSLASELARYSWKLSILNSTSRRSQVISHRRLKTFSHKLL